MVGEDEVRRIAALARIVVPDARVPQLARELGTILDHVESLREVDTGGVPPATGISSGGAPLRVDEGAPITLHREREAFAPAMRDDFFVVPRLDAHAGIAVDPDSDSSA